MYLCLIMITEDYCSYEVAKLLKEKGLAIPITEENNPYEKEQKEK